jgi:hypothetical protein
VAGIYQHSNSSINGCSNHRASARGRGLSSIISRAAAGRIGGARGQRSIRRAPVAGGGLRHSRLFRRRIAVLGVRAARQAAAVVAIVVQRARLDLVRSGRRPAVRVARGSAALLPSLGLGSASTSRSPRS